MDDLFKDEFDMLDKLDWSSTEHFRITQDPDKIINTDPDEEFYIVRRETFGDLQTPEGLQEKTNRYTYTRPFAEDILVRIIDKLKKHYNKSFVEHRGTFMYQPGGRCGWHTNSNAPGTRIYLTWAEEDNKSYFKYFDNETNQIVTKYDKKGWHVNKFIIPREGKLWHFVGSDTNRKSVGFLIPV